MWSTSVWRILLIGHPSTVLVFFSPAGDGICLVLETTSQDHGDMGFVPGSATGTVKNTLTGTMADVWKWEKAVEKKSRYLFVVFANEK